MSDVTVIGLGAMGSAIANAFLNASYDVTVWNRSPEKMDPFRNTGANWTESVAEAGAASPVVVVCINDYPATWQLFEQGLMLSLSIVIPIPKISKALGRKVGVYRESHY